MRLLGLDGCKQNAWVVAESDIEFTEVRFRIEGDLTRLFGQAPSGDAVAVLDVPIGLSNQPRAADLAARKLLGKKGASAVFRPPCREALDATTHNEADAINRRCTGVGLSIMAYCLGPRIRAVDQLIIPAHQEKIREGHPEVSFAVLNGNGPLRHRKKTPEGISERVALLDRAGVPSFDPVAVRAQLGRGRVSVDDVVDAAVMLVTARDVALGTAQNLPKEVEERDARGLVMQMWFPSPAPVSVREDTEDRSRYRTSQRREPERRTASLPSQRPGVGVAILIQKESQILLLKRKGAHGAGTWCPPGGHLEFGESPEECAVREAKEETGVEVTDVRFLAVTNDVFPEGKHYVTIWMEGRYLAGDLTIGAQNEVAEIGWFAWDALPEPQFLSLQHLLEGKSLPVVDPRTPRKETAVATTRTSAPPPQHSE